jgi:DNA-3-methyladenine glycosylase II
LHSRTLTTEDFERGLRELAMRHTELAQVVEAYGPPPLWRRKPGFATLVLIILEQQVSLASARAAFERLHAAIAPVTPRRFLALSDARLKTIGFSRQKAAYTRQLAAAIVERRLKLSALPRLSDDEARSTLMQLKGIGRWSADIYLLMALGRADVWPSSDLALAVAAQEIHFLRARPTPTELIELAEPWRPWRAVAARVLWHFYLSRDRRKTSKP